MRLAKEGANVVVCDLQAEKVKEVAQAIQALGCRSLWFEVDVTDADSVKEMVDQTAEKLGTIDILVNNAGISDPQVNVPTIEQDPVKWQRCVDVSLKGMYLCSKEVGRIMVANKSGHIVNIASMGGLFGFPTRTAYAPAKAGMISLTKTLAVEWADLNIKVNGVAPGYFWTDMNLRLSEQGKINFDHISSKIPMKRMGKIPELVEIVLFLCSDAVSYMTGQTLSVDGGASVFGMPLAL